MQIKGSSWLKFGLFTVGLGQSFVFVIVPPLARDLGLSEIQTSLVFAISAVAWALTSASWGRASDKYGRRNIAVLGLIGYSLSLVAMITWHLNYKGGQMYRHAKWNCPFTGGARPRAGSLGYS